MSFQITGLRAAQFQPLFALADSELRAHLAVRVVADRKPGFPCRVSLKDAEPGETLLLLNHKHLSVDSPYQSSHAIYIRQGARDSALEIDEIPQMLRTRLLSLRAFDSAGMMREADVLPGAELGEAVWAHAGSPCSCLPPCSQCEAGLLPGPGGSGVTRPRAPKEDIR